MLKVAIVNYEMGNLDSIARAIKYCGAQPIITNSESDFKEATHIILPGVGNYNTAINNLNKYNLINILKEQVLKYKIPFLGICLGMQLIADTGYEGGKTNGFGFIHGEVIKFDLKKGYRIPHIGWNEVNIIKENSLFDGIESGKDFYFVHSYHFNCKNESEVLCKTNYDNDFVSVIGKDNIYGTQFHPEKSQKVGFQLLNNFLKLN